MPPIFRANKDFSVGHCYSPRTCLAGSPDVIVNNSPAVRKTDPYGQVHSCNDDSHSMGVAATGSSTVFVNGFGVHRTGDLVSCGDTAGVGSSNVFAG